jgi:hypothetical protein
MKTKINTPLGATLALFVTFAGTLKHNAVRTFVGMASLGVAFSSTPALAQTWQASTDYSSTQGYRNWHYMFFKTSESIYGPLVYGYHNDYESWHGFDELGDIGVDIFSSVMHPGGRGHEAARVWKSPIAGTVRVTGTVAEADGSTRNPAFPGDGVRATIWKNDELLFSADIADLDLVGYGYDLSVRVMPGDWLIFRSEALSNTYYDSTYFDPRVTVDPCTSAMTVYDLKRDWNDTVNPNGVWTYRAGTTLLHGQLGSPHTASDQPVWMGPDNYLPTWFKYIGSPVGDLQTGDVCVHSANYDEQGIANIVWTAPSAGRINVSGAAWIAIDQGRSSVWSLWLNGNLLTSGEVASGDPYDRNSPFQFSTGSGGAGVLQGIAVAAGDQLMLQIRKETGPYGTFVGVNWTIAYDDRNLLADAIIWHQPLARNGASEDTDPSAGRTVKYRFKRGSTIPIQIHALNCAGEDVTSNANIIGTVTVFGDSNCDGAIDDNATPIDFNGVGGGGGVMDKIGGHLKYNLDTKSLPTTTQCYILRVTVTDTSSGEEKFEEALLQAK